MPSIIPNPGPIPVVPPIADIIYTQGNGYVIGAGSTLYAFGIPTIFMSVDELITNHGTAWVESNQSHAFFVGGGSRSSVLNTGLIYVHGQSQVQMATEVNSVVNSGSIYAISDEGWARTLFNSDYPMTVDNSGLIAAQSLGLGSNPNYDYFPNATGIYGVQVELNNRAAGQILAEAPNLAIGVYAGAANITNAGLIEARATTPEGTSFGIYLQTGGTITNSGTIRGDVAIYATYASEAAINTVAQVNNLAGGTIEGLIFLDTGDDVVVNDGAVLGDVDMGDGNDIYSGSGIVSGVVDMGFGDDTYTGGLLGDRAAGARGNDTMRGGAGADLLLGGFGNDTLYGDAGNDGLIGEWGNDVIYTSGGDYVEGGSGNDRVVLGDYTFEILSGGSGVDTLVLAAGARNFSLAQMAANGRASGFEVIELAADQQLAVALADVAAFTGGGNSLRIQGGSSNTIHLGTGWVLGANVTEGSTTWESWSNGGVTVLVSLEATVTGNSIPAFGGFDPFAGGKLAPIPGATAGLGYTNPAVFLYRFVVGDADFTIDAEEIFYSNGAPVFVGTGRHVTTNNGAIYSLDDAFPSALGVDVYHFVNNGLVHVEELAQPGSVYYHPSIAVDAVMVANSGEIYVYSNPGSAIGVMGLYEFNNSGTITAISEHSRAIGVNGVSATLFFSGESHRYFYNTGLIEAEAGGLGSQTYYLGDRFVPENIAATGVQFSGTLTNDGQIVARLSTSADQNLTTAGVYAVNPYGDLAHPSGVINNGLIQGSVAIKFEENYTFDFDNFVINNGVLIGNVEFENGNDTYTGTNGRIDGTVFGFGGTDTMTGGAFADRFSGGGGDDTFTGGGGNDTIWGDSGTDKVIYAGNRADYLVETVNIGGVTYTRVTGLGSAAGDGVDLLRRVETLQFADTSLTLATVANGVPILAAPLADRSVSASPGNNLASFQLAPGSFSDPDPEDTLVYRATMADGSALPWWIQFDATTQSFTVNAGQNFLGSVFNVRVYARDGNPDGGGAEVYDDFTISVVPETGADVNGTSGNDHLFGTFRNESLFGFDGDDLLTGSAGNDVMNGGGGTADTVDYSGASGPITLSLDAGTASGGDIGSDLLFAIEGAIGSAYNDNLTGSNGNDFLSGNLGDDTLHGLDGSDQLFGEAGSDTLYGEGAVDLLSGGAGADFLYGGSGNDALWSANPSLPLFPNQQPYYWVDPFFDRGSEADLLDGGDGDDSLFAGYGDTVIGGSNDSFGDTLYISFMGAGAGVTADFNQASLTIGSGTISGIENTAAIEGSNFDDDLTARTVAPGFNGYTTLAGMGGNDRLVANARTSVMDGGDGNDTIDTRGSLTLQTVSGGAGNDRLIFNAAGNGGNASGGTGTDTLVIDNTNVASFTGLSGFEALELVNSQFALTSAEFAGGFAFNSAVTGTGQLIVGMLPGDMFIASQMSFASTVGITVNGSGSGDVIKGPAGAAMFVNGEGGADQIRSGNLADTILGGDGNDKIMGMGGADTLLGGAGADQFRYLFASDSGLGGAADRILDFTGGSDKLDFRALDANPALAGRQALSFIGTGAFATNGSAQVRYADSGSDTLVQIDLNGDGAADMQIVLVGHAGQALAGTDFLL
ncbi:MAG: putative Ig domain-containing protein [Novosphingobium sp.]